MTAIDDRPPTIGERYTSATESGNLRVTEGRGDVDMLIASGWLEDSLGALLFRLKAEFDSVRGEIDIAKTYARTLTLTLRDLRAEEARQFARMRFGPTNHAKIKGQADVIEAQLRGLVVTERALALTRMHSLSEAKRALFKFADTQATRRRFMESSKALAPLIGQVLEVYLDPLCPSCDGRGFNGGAHRGDKQVICRACRGTGHRKDSVGKDAAQRDFARFILCEMDRIMALAAGGMRQALRTTQD